MGVGCDWLGLPEGEWSDQEGEAALRRALTEVAPTILYAPSNVDYQPEHRRVARVLAKLLAESAIACEVRIYAIQVPLTPLLVNLVHDVSDLEPSIGATLRCYASQQESIACTHRLRRYAARFYGAGAQVEAFCALPAQSYASLHQRTPSHFRPLFLRAWRDPLSAIVGAGERLSWRQQL
jgi:LmbE family N-acetylglucosaminyl deacetylase